jgi:2,4-dienoyl-CoA reductase-like NADH-dependent reductase (Old Yellow Enzyme family)/NADPH-dependent 2,4-dienoyl-CoA reductase/sulfur reductase-like enzyme
MELANRVVLPPMTTMLANADGTLGDRFIEFYAVRAAGGTGLITAEAVEVHPYTHNLSIGDRGFAAIYDDRFLPGLRRFTERMHREGARTSVQLHHAGNAMLQVDPEQPPVAPSAIACPGGQTPRALSIDEIQEIVEAFGQAARRARQAGFDAVDVHGGHGYLIAQFMSTRFNRRTDGYGGDLRGRLRFARELLQEVRRNVGEDFPIIFRISADERVRDGRGALESAAIAPLLVEAGADCLSITTGMHFDLTHTVAGFGMPRGLNVAAAAAVKAAVDVPVIVAGRLDDPLLAEAVIADGKADLVAIGRGLVADPEWARKVRDGRWQEIRSCISCNQGCIGALVSGMSFTCLVNPEAGREWELGFERAPDPKRVLVAGAGPAGLEAARVAASRGHDVTLYERDDALGGQFRLASIPPRKQEIAAYLRYVSRQLEQLGVEVLLGQELTPSLASEARPDAVVVATGCRPLEPALGGNAGADLVTAQEVLAGRARTGERVLVAGGGQLGCETAEFLHEQGRQVSLLEMRPELAVDERSVPRRWLLHNLSRTSVKQLTSTRIVEIHDDGVVVEREGRREVLAGIDTVVLALGAEPENRLARELEGKVAELHVIGDAQQPANALAAIAAGAEVGRRL